MSKPKSRGKWLTLLNYYQQTLAAPDASPQHRAIASAGLRAILRRYQAGKSLTILRIVYYPVFKMLFRWGFALQVVLP